MRPQLVFIFPLRRCASNSLRLHLDLHPDIYAPYPIHIHDFMHLLPLYGDLQEDTNYLKLITDVIGYQNTTLIRWTLINFDPLALFEILKDQPRSIHKIIGEIYLQAAEKIGAKIVIDKSQDSVLYAQEILQLFPSALMIDLVRDPRAQVSSMNNAIIHDFDTILNLQTWIQRRRLMDTLYHQFPQKILTIRYEDFILNQEWVLQHLCKFLSVNYDCNMMNISEEAKRMSQISSLWENNSSPPITENIDKYVNNLSMSEIKLIEWNTEPWMLKLNYLLQFPLEKMEITHSMIQESIENNKKQLVLLPSKIQKENIKDFIVRNFKTRYLKSIALVYDLACD